MQDSNHNREQDKKLARRWWQGLLLMFIVTMAFVFGTMGLFTLFGPMVRNHTSFATGGKLAPGAWHVLESTRFRLVLGGAI